MLCQEFYNMIIFVEYMHSRLHCLQCKNHAILNISSTFFSENECLHNYLSWAQVSSVQYQKAFNVLKLWCNICTVFLHIKYWNFIVAICLFKMHTNQHFIDLVLQRQRNILYIIYTCVPILWKLDKSHSLCVVINEELSEPLIECRYILSNVLFILSHSTAI